MKLEIVADLLGAVAEFIEAHPQGAAFTARKLSGILAEQAHREREQSTREKVDQAVRGF